MRWFDIHAFEQNKPGTEFRLVCSKIQRGINKKDNNCSKPSRDTFGIHEFHKLLCCVAPL